MDRQQLMNGFKSAFGGEASRPRFFHAPGRVNLIGEHIDYNGGYVFPCALSLGTYGLACKRDDGRIRLASGNMTPSVTVAVNDLAYKAEHGWANYPKSVVAALLEKGYAAGGFDLYVWGDLPNSAGLSSSASVELLTCYIVDALYGLQIDPIERVKLCQRAENQYIGVNCGIMDQFAVGMGRINQAILLNCDSLTYAYTPLDLMDCKIIIANTNKPRGLADSKYNERRNECETALKSLQSSCDIAFLCALTPEVFEEHKHLIQDPVVVKRAAHAVYENARTLAAVKCLEKADLNAFGKLLNESHVSLRDLYEVTGAELDALAESAWCVDGVLGSRMTGAGFGGCTVSIVKAAAVENFKEKVSRLYTARTGLTADFYMAETGDGAREI